MVGLLERGFSERGVLDLVLAFKALAANRMHQPCPYPYLYPYP